MATATGFSTTTMNHDLATKPATWNELLQIPAMALRLTATAEITGLKRVQSVTGAIVDELDKATEQIGKWSGHHITASADSSLSTEKLAHDFRDAVLRDFFKTQVRAPINAALAKLADALVPHMGLGVDDASDVLRDAAKSIEAGQRFADSGQVDLNINVHGAAEAASQLGTLTAAVVAAKESLADTAAAAQKAKSALNEHQITVNIGGHLAGSAANVGPALQKALNERKAGKRY